MLKTHSPQWMIDPGSAQLVHKIVDKIRLIFNLMPAYRLPADAPVRGVVTEVLMEQSKARQLESLYRAERQAMERIACKRVGQAGAADVVQDVFAALWSSAREQVTLSPAYIAQATKFTAISHFRSSRRRENALRGMIEEQYRAPVPTSEQIALCRDDLRRLESIVLSLPARARQVFLLHRVHGCTYQEIAIGLGISVSTVERDMAMTIMSLSRVDSTS